MFDKDRKFYPAATLALFISLVIIVWALMTRNAGADEILIDGHREKAVCETLYTEPVTIRCVSVRHTCNFYPETGQLECVQR